MFRRATPQDTQEMAALLVSEAEQRTAINPKLWPKSANARAEIERTIAASFEPAPQAPPEVWVLAEADGHIVGISHAMVVSPPPIYAVEGRSGLILDDSFTVANAPDGTSTDLLAATEMTLKEMGASGLIASSLEAGPWRTLFQKAGYEPVTLYMSNSSFAKPAAPASARRASAGDVPAIVSLSARHRATLQNLNPRFWAIHPEADARFKRWMDYSLTLLDRDLLVEGPPGEITGYVVAQPITSLHIPAGHDPASVGVIDDFYSRDYAEVPALADCGRHGAALLAAAEHAFALREVETALAVCPAAWISKKTLLEQEGYRTAKLWMLKG